MYGLYMVMVGGNLYPKAACYMKYSAACDDLYQKATKVFSMLAGS